MRRVCRDLMHRRSGALSPFHDHDIDLIKVTNFTPISHPNPKLANLDHISNLFSNLFCFELKAFFVLEGNMPKEVERKTVAEKEPGEESLPQNGYSPPEFAQNRWH